MSFELELKKRQEEFGRIEASYLKEISILRAEAKLKLVFILIGICLENKIFNSNFFSQKEDDLMDSKMKQNELKLLVENLNSQLGQKVMH